ncbi:MAG TPA: hypothetical protein VI755_11575 [Anaerolineales bacterium]|nr:hypothetical protein [Anaerolineales bacterium]
MLLESLQIPVQALDNTFRASIAGIAGLVAGFTAGAVAAFKATEKWALELDGIQDVIGGTAKQAAAFNFVLRKSGTDTGTLTKGLTILGKGLVDAHGRLDTTGKALRDWGINVKDANGVLKDQGMLMGEISEKYNSFATQQERVNFLTEVFGRSGAELVDFFDTLAQEGGIDAVAEKVERLGLAIDPGRYEQFNRNLEELKLIGLGLAVGFTEKVMPALEGFLELLSDPNLTLGSFLQETDEFIGGLIDDLGTSIDNWIAGGGPEELSEKIVSWVEKLGDGEGSKSKILAGAQHLMDAMVKAVGEIDWAAIGEAIDEKTAETINKHDWKASGDSFGDAIERLFTTDLESRVQLDDQWLLRLALPGVYVLTTFFQTSSTGQAIKDAVVNWFTGAVGEENIDAFSRMFTTISTKISEFVTTTIATMATWRANFSQIFLTGGQLAANNLTMGFAPAAGMLLGRLSSLGVEINTKLRDIAKTFFQRALAWTQQAVQGFENGKQRILSAVQELRDSINTILRGIIRSITISVNASMPNWLANMLDVGGGGGGGGTTGGGTTGGGSRPGPKRRASGGPVIAGQSYQVAEFFQPEVFRPNVNGRVEPMQPQLVAIDEDRLATVFGRVLGVQLQKAGWR